MDVDWSMVSTTPGTNVNIDVTSSSNWLLWLVILIVVLWLLYMYSSRNKSSGPSPMVPISDEAHMYFSRNKSSGPSLMVPVSEEAHNF